jgi:hypothetical protein
MIEVESSEHDETQTGRAQWRARTPLIVIILITLLGMVIVTWGAFHENTAQPLDAASTDQLAHACDQALHELRALPQITGSSTLADRAGRVDTENRILVTIPDVAARLQPPNHEARAALRGWVGDWHTLLAVRERYARELRADLGRPELVLPVANGQPITQRMIDFASTHNLEQCQTDNLQAEIVDGVRQYPTNLGT